MMKRSDVTAATALIIQGFIRENESGLRECLDAISGEVDDWAENLGDGAVDNINVKIDAPRTPFYLRAAIKALTDELHDLDGINIEIPAP